MMVPLKFMTASTPLKWKYEVSVKQYMAAGTLLKTTLKKLFPVIKPSNLQGKNVFRNNYFWSQPFLYFTKIFGHLQQLLQLHLSAVAVVSYFSVYKLIGWDPLNLYFFKVTSINTTKSYGICPELTINTVGSRSGVLFVNFKHTLQFFSVSIVNFEQVNVFLA